MLVMVLGSQFWCCWWCWAVNVGDGVWQLMLMLSMVLGSQCWCCRWCWAVSVGDGVWHLMLVLVLVTGSRCWCWWYYEADDVGDQGKHPPYPHQQTTLLPPPPTNKLCRRLTQVILGPAIQSGALPDINIWLVLAYKNPTKLGIFQIHMGQGVLWI